MPILSSVDAPFVAIMLHGHKPSRFGKYHAPFFLGPASNFTAASVENFGKASNQPFDTRWRWRTRHRKYQNEEHEEHRAAPFKAGAPTVGDFVVKDRLARFLLNLVRDDIDPT
jgi:hypothetical protein